MEEEEEEDDEEDNEDEEQDEEEGMKLYFRCFVLLVSTQILKVDTR